MIAAPPSHRLSLAAHVRVCDAEGQVIMLDLRKNRYLGIDTGTSRALALQVNRWPITYPPGDPVLSPSDPSIQRLKLQGLLADELPGCNPDEMHTIATASMDIDAASIETSIDTASVIGFLASAATAAWWLRTRSLESIVKAVVGRRERLKVQREANPDSLEAMQRRAALYERLRPLVFTARDRCLHDSLALTCFLTAEGFLARWMVGVKTGPFGAHSWVQSGPTVLNDQHEYVRRFQPILVV